MPRHSRQSFASRLLPPLCKALGFIVILTGLTWAIHWRIADLVGPAGTPSSSADSSVSLARWKEDWISVVTTGWEF
jgi:hypothetical protein